MNEAPQEVHERHAHMNGYSVRVRGRRQHLSPLGCLVKDPFSAEGDSNERRRL